MTKAEDKAAELKPRKRLQLIRSVYMTVLNQTESFEPDDVGVQLAYLLGAIAMNSCVELTRGEPIHNILDRRFHRKHLIWAFITFDDT